MPRIKDKVLITPDLNTIFGAKAEELSEIFSLLTRVLDGQGLVTDSGVYGTRDTAETTCSRGLVQQLPFRTVYGIYLATWALECISCM
ncbi:MAG: hypothetical protein QMD23_06350 [Candidatus Bathyarchaeia archaeon]|nr:hypothetical protein [Candidatus Bathyarchaeia archaeon]